MKPARPLLRAAQSRANITRRYPPKVGLQDDLLYGKERWFVEMFFPLFPSKRVHSTLARAAPIEV